MPTKINRVQVRMYCLGTGDCFVVKFLSGKIAKFTMMIDCGTCQGTAQDVKPYVEHLAKYVNNHVDLLVITHEHNDHVNGFQKCASIFANKTFKIDEAWFAWTENPEDPDDRAKDLQKKRSKMKNALVKAIAEVKRVAKDENQLKANEYYRSEMVSSHNSMLDGLQTLASINLAGNGVTGEPLEGMKSIKEIVKKKKVKVKYLTPGQTIKIPKLDGLKFHILGPPFDREKVFKDGKEGTDVFKRRLNLYESSLAVRAFDQVSTELTKDLPFTRDWVAQPSAQMQSGLVKMAQHETNEEGKVISAYQNAEIAWRRIDTDWLNVAGSLALRLNSHINNTSLVMAIESESSSNVILFPGDAEYGSWESWFDIEKWKGKGPDKKHFVEDLLNRTVFYKVSHHLSFNGTPIQKGVKMLESPDLAVMATLDRNRISSRWKSTMPNSELMKELMRRTQGRFFIMDEFEIDNAPSTQFDPTSLGNDVYATETFDGEGTIIFKQYAFSF